MRHGKEDPQRHGALVTQSNKTKPRHQPFNKNDK